MEKPVDFTRLRFTLELLVLTNFYVSYMYFVIINNVEAEECS